MNDVKSVEKISNLNELTSSGPLDILGVLSSPTTIALPASDLSSSVPFVQYFLAKNPEQAQQILKNLPEHDLDPALDELLLWASFTGDRLPQLQGLIDVVQKMGKLDSLMNSMHVRAKSAGLCSLSAYDAFCLLADAGDIVRVKILIAAAKEADTLKEMLNSDGNVMRIAPTQDMSGKMGYSLRMNMQGPQAALRACVSNQRTEIFDLLIDTMRQEDMLADLMKLGTLPLIMLTAARNGDFATIIKISALADELETYLEKRGDQATTVEQSMAHYDPQHAQHGGLKGVLLHYSDNQNDFGPESAVNIALRMRNFRLLEVLSEMAEGDLRREEVFREEVNLWVNWQNELNELHNRVFGSQRAPISIKAGEFTELLPELMKLPDNKGEEETARRESQPAVIDETPKDVPNTFNFTLYNQLLPLMKAADKMERAEGEGPDWARKLTLVFGTVEEVKQYLNDSIKWAGENQQNPILWRNQSGAFVRWPEDIQHPKYVNTGAFKFAMGFEVPSVSNPT